jgi:DNA-binding MarR family transcriptional regulator
VKRREEAARPAKANGGEPIADLGDKPGHLIRRAHQLQAAIFEECAGRYRLTPVQHVIMTALYRHPGVDQATLASLVALDKVTVGAVVVRLERRNLVARSDSPEDRRSWALSLTPAGVALLKRMQPAIRQSQTRLLAPLTAPERAQFVALMQRIVGMAQTARRRKAA